MNRLLQGDVGSGKTVLAFLALILCAENGRQGALMTPTEVLARQHFEKLEKLRAEQKLDVLRPVLLTGSMTYLMPCVMKYSALVRVFADGAELVMFSKPASLK